MGIADWLGIGKTVAEVSTSLTDGATDIILAAKGTISTEDKGKLKILQEQGIQKIESIVENSVNEARKFAIQYEGSAEKIPKWLLTVRSLIRPVVTVYMFGWFFVALTLDLYHLIKSTEGYVMVLKQLPKEFWWIFGTIVVFWFGGKAVERAIDHLKPKAE